MGGGEIWVLLGKVASGSHARPAVILLTMIVGVIKEYSFLMLRN